jgi:1-phosphatidylinositol-3-phosphate 5-kinase
LLKGANGDELKKVKHVVQYGVFAAYNLALETSFLVDEGATLPELPLKSPIIVALPDKPSSADRSISTIPILQMSTASSPNSNFQATDKDGFKYNDFGTVDQTAAACFPDYRTCERFGVGSTQTSSVQINDQNGNISCLLGMDPRSYIDPLVQQSTVSLCHCPACTINIGNEVKYEELQPETTRHELANGFSVLYAGNSVPAECDLSFSHNSENSMKVAAKTPAPLNLEISDDNGSSEYGSTIKKVEIPASPADNQSILVSISSRCVWKEAICERPHLLRIKYYGNFDKPLGRFLLEQLFDQVRPRSLIKYFLQKRYILLNFYNLV